MNREAMVKFLNNSEQPAMIIPFHQQSQVIRNLRKHTTYTVQLSVTISIRNQKSKIRTTATGTTYFYLPDPITSAYVENSLSNNCFIVWKHYAPHGKNISFKITGTFVGNGLTFNKEVILNRQKKGSYRYNIDLSQYDFCREMFVSFTIQAVSSCGAASLLTKVSGRCQVPSPPTSFPVLFVVVLAACVLLIVGVALLLIIQIRKRRTNKNQVENQDQRNGIRVLENLGNDESVSASASYQTLDDLRRPSINQEHHYEAPIQQRLYQNISANQNMQQTNTSTSNCSKIQSSVH